MKPTRSDKLDLPDGVCAHCGATFPRIARRDLVRKRFCSRRCGTLYNHAHGVLHPKGYVGEHSPHWKGGRFVDHQGYVKLWVGNARYAAEHRLVMERTLGRKLTKGEHVHHINGVRDDNRPENLELWTNPTQRRQPTGVRHAERKHCPTCTCFD